MNLWNSLGVWVKWLKAAGGGVPGALQCTGCETQQHTVRIEITGQAEGGCQQILSIPCDGERGSGVHSIWMLWLRENWKEAERNSKETTVQR